MWHSDSSPLSAVVTCSINYCRSANKILHKTQKILLSINFENN